MKKAYLLLADGTLFEGTAVGYEGQSIGEVVFNTGMAGYQEVLTDPSYYGQVVTMTYPLVYPLAGTLILLYVWSGFDHLTQILGFSWLAVGIVFGYIKSKGYKEVPDAFKKSMM